MIAAVVAIIVALIGYFSAKKGGADDTTAGLVAVGAGAGTYYAATQTEWGKKAILKLEDWVGIADANGSPVLDSNGQQVTGPQGSVIAVDDQGKPLTDVYGNPLVVAPGYKVVPETDESGNQIVDGFGKLAWKAVDETGKTLRSWGGYQTATVVGASKAAGLLDDNPWILPVGLGVAALVILK